MSRRVSSYTIAVGDEQQIAVAQGEDRELRLTFTVDGSALNMSGTQAIVMTVRNRTNGILAFARSYSGFVDDDPVSGTPFFIIGQGDTLSLEPGPYDVDILLTDASGYFTQLLALSTFMVMRRLAADGDEVTTPPAVPVVYGLNWLGEWTGKSGGYQVNDAVIAIDGSLGSTAYSSFRASIAGVTLYPVNASLVPATGWMYIAQHGG